VIKLNNTDHPVVAGWTELCWAKICRIREAGKEGTDGLRKGCWKPRRKGARQGGGVHVKNVKNGQKEQQRWESKETALIYRRR